MEEWKWINGYEGLYKIFRDGTVVSNDRLDRFNRKVGGIIKPQKTGSKRQYLFVPLFKDKKVKQKYVHRLVAEAFLPNPQNKRCVDHINGNTFDNSVNNLRWVTHKENMNNPITRQRMLDESYKYVSQSGIDNPFSRKVAMFTLNGEKVGDFDSVGQIEKQFGIRSASISRVCYGKRAQTHGYVFKFIGEAERKIARCSIERKNKRAVLQLDLNGNIIAEYPSAMKAGEAICGFPENITRAVRGIYKTYKGYKWRYK